MRVKIRNISKVCTLLLVMSLIITGIPMAFSRTAEASAVYQLGDNVTGVLEGTTLRVSGTGATYDTFDSSQLSSDITTIVIENGVTNIGYNMFDNMSGLRTVEMADSVTRIENTAFARCSNLNSITFSKNLISIGNLAFCQSEGPSELILPEGLQTIGDSAFDLAGGISSIFIPHTVTEIGHYAFSNIPNLSKVVCLAESIGLGNGIFQNSGTSVLPSEPKTLYGYTGFLAGTATSGYTQVSLLKINMGTYVNGTIAGDTHYVYGTGDTSIFSGSPFAGLPGIENIVIGGRVTTIGGQMFAGLTEVESITIPTNITTIRNSAFANMPALREITYLYNGDADVHEDAFKDIGTNPITLNIRSSNISAANATRNAGAANFTINLTDNPLFITHELAPNTHSAVVTIHAVSPNLVGIRFKINDGEWADYTSPFTIEENATITAMARYWLIFDEISDPYTISGIVPEPLVTTYKVEHYKQELNGTYVKTATDNLTGTTGAAVTAAAKTYTGFSENVNHASRVASGTISADGSTVLKVYYDRNDYTVSFVNHNGTVLATEDVLYNDLASALTAPTRAFHTFAGWFTDNETFSNKWNFTDNQVTGNINLYAKWTRIPQSINRVNVDPKTTITVNGLNDKVRLPESDNANTADIVVFVKAEPTKVPEIIKDKAAAEMSKKGLTMLNVFDIGLYKRITTYEGATSESEISNSDITGKITVQIPLTEEQAKKDNLAIAYVDDDGSVTIIQGKIVTVGSTKYFEFETDHFSMYSLVEVVKVSVPTTGEKPYPAIGFAMLILATVIYVNRKRFGQEDT